ncbi:hypothetical protein E4U40_000134 [Claviceps sp. LM458 group G5]|nr:hypothetical protein E4U40_000134 [Claviceps sp. LM458 group G5]
MDALPLHHQDGANSVQTAAAKKVKKKKIILRGIMKFAIQQEFARCIRQPRISLGNNPVLCRTLMNGILVGPNTI